MAVNSALKSRITVLRYQHHMPVKTICVVLGLKKSTVYSVLQHQRLFGYTPKAKPQHSRSRKLDAIDINVLRGLLEHTRTMYLDELQKQLLIYRGKSVSLSTISRSLERMNITHKRVSGIAVERNDMRHFEFINLIGELVLDPHMLMFTDESAKDERTQDRRNGWAPANTRCTSRVHFVRGQRFSILPLLTLEGIITYDIIEGSVTVERFLEFLQEFVVRTNNCCISCTNDCHRFQ